MQSRVNMIEVWYLLSALQVPQQVARELAVLVAREQRVGGAGHAGAARAPHAVRVRVHVARHRVVHHRADVRDVEAARCTTDKC